MAPRVIIILWLLIGILFVPPIQAFAQTLDQMISHMRFTHSQLSQNIDEVTQLIKSNHTAEAIILLEGMDIRINHMNAMFDDLIWELSNKGH